MEENVSFTYVEEGEYAPREGLPYVKRENIAAIIKYQSQYLFLFWKEVDYGYSLVTGGIEENEARETALLREVMEETGYYDVKRVIPIDCINHSLFFVAHKNQNREATYYPYLVELNSLKRHEMEDSEMKEHACLWVEESDLEQMTMFENHKMMLKKTLEYVRSSS